MHTMCFRYPEKRRFYISLNVLALKTIMWDWLGVIHDFLVLQEMRLDDPSIPFHGHVPFKIVYVKDDSVRSVADEMS